MANLIRKTCTTL